MKEYKNFDDLFKNGLGLKSINRLSLEKHNKIGYVVNGDDRIDIGFKHHLNFRKMKMSGMGKVFKWIRKYYITIIGFGLVFRILWRVSIMIYKMKING